jgi:hypothetical protein
MVKTPNTRTHIALAGQADRLCAPSGAGTGTAVVFAVRRAR